MSSRNMTPDNALQMPKQELSFDRSLNDHIAAQQSSGRLKYLVFAFGVERIDKMIAEGEIAPEFVAELRSYVDERRAEVERQEIRLQAPAGRIAAPEAEQDKALSARIIKYALMDNGVLLEEKMATDAAFRDKAKQAYEEGKLTDKAHSLLKRQLHIAKGLERLGTDEHFLMRYPAVKNVDENIAESDKLANTLYAVAFGGLAIGAVATGIGAVAIIVNAITLSSSIGAAGGVTAMLGSLIYGSGGFLSGFGAAVGGLASVGASAVPLAVGIGFLFGAKQIRNEAFKNKQMVETLLSERVEIKADDAAYMAFNYQHDLTAMLSMHSGRQESWHYLANSGPAIMDVSIKKLEANARQLRYRSVAFSAGTGAGLAASVLLFLNKPVSKVGKAVHEVVEDAVEEMGEDV